MNTPETPPAAAESANAPENNATESRTRPRWLIPAIISAAIALVLAVTLTVVLPTVISPMHQVQGTMQLLGSNGDTSGDWNDCHGTGGYSDIQPGASATMRDAKGDIIGSISVTNLNRTTLHEFIDADTKYGLGGWGGDATKVESTLSKLAGYGAGCVLYFKGQVKDADFYSFTFADRGALTYSKQDLEHKGWWIALNLGN